MWSERDGVTHSAFISNNFPDFLALEKQKKSGALFKAPLFVSVSKDSKPEVNLTGFRIEP